jgi:hypothetical protein
VTCAAAVRRISGVRPMPVFRRHHPWGKSMTTTRNRAVDAVTTGRARSAAISEPICAAILAHHTLVAQYIGRFNEDIPRRIIDECDELLSHVIFDIQGEAAMKRAAMDLPRRLAAVIFNNRPHGSKTGLSAARNTAPQRGRLRYEPAAAEARA